MRPSPRHCAPLLGAACLIASIPSSTSVGVEPGDAERGKAVFQWCYACHSVDPNETARLQGPSLLRVLGRPAASVPDFDYSDAMREKAKAGLTWDAATLMSFVANPESIVPGTKMALVPLRREQDRADLIAYLDRAAR